MVSITRKIITITSVKGYLLEKDIGLYFAFSSFQNPTAKLLKETLNKLVKQNDRYLESLILDFKK